MGAGQISRERRPRAERRLLPLWRHFVCALAVAFLAGSSGAVQGAPALLRVGAYSNDMSALDYIDHAGVRQGPNASVLRAISQRQGWPLAYRQFSSVGEAWSALYRGDVDIVPVACKDPIPNEGGVLSAPYASMGVGVVTSRGRRVPATLADLAGERVVVARSSLGAAALGAQLHDAVLIEASERRAALEAVADGRADAFVGIHALNVGAVNALALGTLESTALPLSIALCLASRKTDERVAAIIARGLAGLSPDALDEIGVQPLPTAIHRVPEPSRFRLNDAERDWLSSHPVVRVGVQRLGRPYDFVDDQGRWQGLGATLLKQFAQTAGVRFEAVVLDVTLEPAKALRSGAVDLMSSFPLAAGTMPGFAATRAYDSFPWSFVRVAGGDEAGAGRIATTPWRMRRVLPEPGLDEAALVPRPDAAGALRAVLAGNADAALVNVIAAEELGDRYAHGRLSIDPAIAGIERIGFAADERNRTLVSMLDRYLASYGPRELARLASRARPLTIVLGYEKHAVRGLTSAGAAVALSIIATLVWAYRRTRAAQRVAVAARHEADAAREQALAADRAKSAFVAMMSHEIRTPMNGVVGVLDLLDTMALDVESRRYLDIAQHSARLMLRVVDDTLDYLKIEQAALTLEAAPFDIDSLAAAAVGLHAPLAGRKGCAVYLAAMPHFDRRLIGDEARINQILTNLLSNAIRFTERGYVLLEVRRKVARGQTWLILRVTDTGVGISEAYRSRLFTPFTQQDGGTTRRYGGTGLGLSIVKRVVDLMSGTIEVESRAGEGTRVRVRLPIEWGEGAREWPRLTPSRAFVHMPVPAMAVAVRASLTKMGIRCVSGPGQADIAITADERGAVVVSSRHDVRGDIRSIDELTDAVVACLGGAGTGRSVGLGPEDANPAAALTADNTDDARQFEDAALRSGAGKPVLVIDDNGVNRDIIVRQLRALGVAAESAGDGIEGYAYWRRLRPALVLLDCHMPGMDGYTLARNIRRAECEGGARTTIVAISANATRDDERACREAGMDDYLSKPITRLKLASLLERRREAAYADEGPARI